MDRCAGCTKLSLRTLRTLRDHAVKVPAKFKESVGETLGDGLGLLWPRLQPANDTCVTPDRKKRPCARSACKYPRGMSPHKTPWRCPPLLVQLHAATLKTTSSKFPNQGTSPCSSNPGGRHTDQGQKQRRHVLAPTTHFPLLPRHKLFEQI